MAKMGQRAMSEKKQTKAAAKPAPNLIVGVVAPVAQIHATAAVVVGTPVHGVSIMPDGFVTSTGLLPSATIGPNRFWTGHFQ